MSEPLNTQQEYNSNTALTLRREKANENGDHFEPLAFDGMQGTPQNWNDIFARGHKSGTKSVKS